MSKQEEFKVLSDIEHVKIRRGMYLGSCSNEPISGIINFKHQTLNITQGLIKIVEEIYQNSIDAFIRHPIDNFKIDISINNTVEGCEITISDTGCGIPVVKHGETYRPVLAWTQMRAGTSFSDERKTIGANGLGSVACAILSSYFRGETHDGKNKCIVEAFDGLQKVEFKVGKSSKHGTTVSFIPDLSYFDVQEFTNDHVEFIRDQVRNLSIIFKDIQFSFNGEKIVYKNIKQIAKNFHADAISFETDKFSLIFAPSGETEEFRCLSYVNGILNKNQGSHVDFIMEKIISPIRELVKKKHKIEVLPAQIKSHLLLAVYLREFQNLRFDSQTKDRITNTRAEVSEYFGDFDFELVAKKVISTPSIIDPMISAILFKKEQAERMLLAKKQKAANKLKIANHIAAKSGDNKQLYLFEGLSASSNFLNVRAPNMGCYSLRGKVKNVRGEKHVDILKNKEIFELLAIIGLKLGEKATDLNYDEIIFSCDSDTDGKNIICLLINLFSFWPELFEEKRIKILLSPLYICNKGKEEKYFYSSEEFDKFNSKGWDVNYIKGLGGLPLTAYREMLYNPRTVIITSEGIEKLEMAFGNSAELRKQWMME